MAVPPHLVDGVVLREGAGGGEGACRLRGGDESRWWPAAPSAAEGERYAVLHSCARCFGQGWPASACVAGGKIDQYSPRQLAQLVTRIESDGMLRTEDELVDEVKDELGFSRRGKNIVAGITAAIALSRRQRRRAS
jgi:hypothetical protein